MNVGQLIFVFVCCLLLSCNGDDNSIINKRQVDENENIEEWNETQIHWHFEDVFTVKEKERLENWIRKVYNATEKTLGKYPFPVHVYFHDAGTSSEPVPWAHTKRYPTQQVHFYVDLNYTDQEFLDDWTAPHEISHLSIPFLGKENAWFAEGFASFWQYQIMHTLGVLSEVEMENEYQRQWKKNLHHIKGAKPYLICVQKQRNFHNYPAMYWGGAYFFYVYHKKLINENKSFHGVMKAFLKCCRFKCDDYPSIVEKWDKLSNMKACNSLLKDFESWNCDQILEKYSFR